MAKTIRISARKGSSHCALPPMLDLRAAPALRAALLRALAKKRDLTLDAATVERLSTACIQLLVAAGTAFKAAGHSISLNNPSPAFADAFNDLGLEPVLEKWTLET